MGYVKVTKLVTVTLLSLSILAASISSAFVTVAYAAPAENEPVVQEETSSNQPALIGLAALALLAVMNNKSSSSESKTPAKTPLPATSPAPSLPTVSQPPATSSPNYNTLSSSGLSADEQQAFNLLNADRNANGLPSLKVNTKLNALAEQYAQDMIDRGYFSHYDPEGRSPFDRMQQAGITYRSAGENLAINRSVAAAENAFMNSSGHRANILNSSYTEVGIGVKYSPNGSVYVVQEFIGR